MNQKKGVGGLIRLLKFDADDGVDPKTLFEGAKLTMRESLARKPSLGEGCGNKSQFAEHEPVDGEKDAARFEKQRARYSERPRSPAESKPIGPRVHFSEQGVARCAPKTQLDDPHSGAQ